MKRKDIYGILCSCMIVAGCSAMDEMVPAGSTTTSTQIKEATETIPDRSKADLAGIYAYAGETYAVLGANQHAHNDFGYPSIAISQDANGPDMVCDNSNYNWFSVSYDYSDRNDNYIVCYLRFAFQYNQIKLANEVIKTMAGIDMATAPAELRYTTGQAKAVRAFDYLALAPYYQFRYQDNKDKPCVPLVTEETVDFGNNPRATVERVYTQIIKDLDDAVDLLEGYNRGTDKSKVDQSVAYGLRARANLYMGRYAEAAADAEKAMAGYSPSSIEEAGVPALCSLNEHNWMWGILMEADKVSGLPTWPSKLGSFTAKGYTTGTGVYKCINKLLYDKIPDSDVRKGWWVNENLTSPLLDKIEWNGKTGRAISTLVIPNTKKAFVPYTVVKFGMESGIGSTDNSSDWCLMRVEEMELIRAEGLAMSGQETQAKTALENFIRSYRDPEYSCNASTAEELQDEIWFQRRVELWGEGHSMADIMRLEKPVVRIHGNNKANWPSAFAFNVEARDPYLLLRFPQQETNTNSGIPSSENKAGTQPVPGQKDDLRDGITD